MKNALRSPARLSLSFTALALFLAFALLAPGDPVPATPTPPTTPAAPASTNTPPTTPAVTPPPVPPAPSQDPQTQLGNIFLDNEPVVIQCLATGDSVDYSVKDFWGQVVDSGKAPVQAGVASIKPNIKVHGYFEMTVNTGSGSKELTFGIIAPVDFASLAGSPFNVCTHFITGNWNHDLMPLLPRLGIPQVREDLTWRWIETDKEGVYNFTRTDAKGNVDSRIQDVYDDLKKSGISQLPDAAYCSNKIYDHTEAPITQNGCDAFGRFCVASLAHFPDFKQIEIWNEYNGSWGPPKGTPAEKKPILYTQMLKAVYEAVKQSNPNVEVLGGAMVRVPIPYMETLFQAGALNYMDGLVVHPYIGEPEVFYRTFNDARALMRKYNNGQEKPIWATEYSWGNWSTRDIQQHADFLVRGSVIMAAENVNRMYWFELRDSAMFNGGQCLVHSDTDPRGKYSPTPAAIALATLIRVLHDGKFQEREAVTPFTRTWVFHFLTSQGDVRACWYSGDDKSQIVLQANAPLTKIDIMGNETQIVPQGGKITLTLDETPFYLKGQASGVTEVPTAWKTIANSVDDSSDTQGNNGWHPGYFEGTPGPAPATLDPAAFKEMTLKTDNWGYRWIGLNDNDSRVSDSSDLWTSAKTIPSNRWVSTMDGKVTLRGYFRLPKGPKDKFASMESAIYVDGKSVFAQETPTPTVPNEPVHYYTVPFEIPVDVKTGTVIDFTVPAGPGVAIHPRVDASICVSNPDYHP